MTIRVSAADGVPYVVDEAMRQGANLRRLYGPDHRAAKAITAVVEALRDVAAENVEILKRERDWAFEKTIYEQALAALAPAAQDLDVMARARTLAADIDFAIDVTEARAVRLERFAAILAPVLAAMLTEPAKGTR